MAGQTGAHGRSKFHAGVKITCDRRSQLEKTRREKSRLNHSRLDQSRLDESSILEHKRVTRTKVE
eukprot:10467133-Lingulodinium_polyedra.AAC.1